MTTSVMPSYSRTRTGILGKPRETMLTNELLLKDKLGRPRPHGYRNPYPGESFIYGMAYPQGVGGVNEALHGWPGAELKLAGRNALRVERDFMAMNKEAIRAGMVNVPQQEQFRQTHNILRRIDKVVASTKAVSSVPRLPPNYVFGMSTRPTTPIFDLLENKYQDNWIKQRRALELAKRKETKKNDMTTTVNTRTSLLRSYQPPIEPGKLWQMKRWSSAGPSLETFRSDALRERSFKAMDTDKNACKGRNQGGIYNGAQEFNDL